jgi:hypothetical protein
MADLVGREISGDKSYGSSEHLAAGGCANILWPLECTKNTCLARQSMQTLSLLLQEIEGDSAERVVDQFNAALHYNYTSLSGMSGIDADGYLRSEVRVSTSGGRYPGDITWVLKRRLNGTLVSVTASGFGERWTESAQRFFSDVLASALANATKPFVHRRPFLYFGPNLSGEYWFRQIRVAPLHPNDNDPDRVTVERCLVVDHEIPAPDQVKAYLCGEEAARRYGARVSFLLDVGVRVEERRQRWVSIRQRDATVEHVRGESGITIPHWLEALPKKGAQCDMGRFEGDTHLFGRSGRLTFPRHARSLWRTADAADVATRSIFDSMCQLYQVGRVIEDYYPTAALAYFVSAAEAASTAPDSGSSFGEFMRTFTPEIDGRAAMVERLYRQLRSSHFHAGQFALGDFGASSTTLLGEPGEKQRGDFYYDGRKLLRSALVNWSQRLAAGAF